MTRIKVEHIRNLPTAKIAIRRKVQKNRRAEVQARVHYMIILTAKSRSVNTVEAT